MKQAGLLTFLGIGAWCVAVFSGYAAFIAHHFASVETPLPPAAYPASAPAPVADSANLLMFVHPKCPCTQASLKQLAEIVGQAGSALAAHVFVYAPRDAEPDWHAGANWDLAAAIPRGSLSLDEEGRLARLFEAATSGTAVLYDASGNLAFSGGITSQRGHVGQSTGGDAVLAAVRGETPGVRMTPVFGCGLLDRATGMGTLP